MRVAVTTEALTHLSENAIAFGKAVIPLLAKTAPEIQLILHDEDDHFPDLSLETIPNYGDARADAYLDLSGTAYFKNIPGVAAVLNFDGSPSPPESWWRKLFPAKDWLGAELEKATRIIVTHHAMKRALRERYPTLSTTTTVVGHGLPLPKQRVMPADSVTRRITKEVYGKEHSYFYAPTHDRPSDNLERLFQAYDVFRDRCSTPVRLVVGGGFYSTHSRAVRKARKKSSYRDDIVLLPSLPETERHKLITAAHAVLYPSLSTIFPLPVLDAWTAEVPVLYTDNDILQGAGALVQGEDVRSIADGMLAIVTTPFLASGLIENGKRRREDFNWGKVAERVAGVLREVGESSFNQL